jgi:hypothetical protein
LSDFALNVKVTRAVEVASDVAAKPVARGK